MDNETKFVKINTQAASSDAQINNTNKTPTAASSDALIINMPRSVSQNALKRKPPKAAFSDAPRYKKTKLFAASKDAMRKAIARHAPNKAASKAIPTPSASKHALTDTTLSVGPRAVLVCGDSTVAAGDDAPTGAASASTASDRDLTILTEAPPVGTPNTTQGTSTTVSCKMSSSKGRLSTLTEQQDVVAAPVEVSETRVTPTSATAMAIKRKRTLRPRRKKKHPTTDGELAARAHKRVRPEDSVIPTGIKKKSKPARSRMVGGSLVTYAEAAASYRNNELCVAVMTEPFEEMTQEQAEGIRLNIEKQLRALLMADPDPSNPTENTAIRFRGKAHFAEGVLKSWCEDAFTVAWLKRITNNMPSPIPGTNLTVRPQAEIPKKALCMLFVPENTEDTPALLKLLTRQNPNLSINTWTLTHERVRQEPPGTCLFFRVPESMVQTIKNQERRVYYLMGSIYIRFLEEGVANEDVTTPSTATVFDAPGPRFIRL